MRYKNFTLDDFQVEAIKSIENNNSVVVSAATGTGKTLIADYTIDKYIALGYRIIYTAPIKALSNQKYKDFKADFGEDKVGIMTGDVVINPAAQVLVMTTEIYRNMLITNDPGIDKVSYVVFDEIHFINDIERGTVWEESIIFSPDHVRFLCLSATIPNAREFADWIESIKNHTVDVVKYAKRAVPLSHMLYDKELGITNAAALEQSVRRSPPQRSQRFRKGKRQRNDTGATHYDLVEEIEDKLPAIFFSFSRRDCENKSKELFQRFNFSSPAEKSEILKVVGDMIPPDLRRMHSVQNIKLFVQKGIAYHHAGMLPVLKDVVETLFSKGLIKVLYTTETFAVGVNYPAKTVCFASLRKFDGISFRFLNSKEYFQLAGRAGRRGLDDVGYVIVMIDRNDFDFEQVIRVTKADVEKIVSQFKLSFNTVLNMVNNHDEETIEKILKSNFDYYLRKKSNKQIRIMASYRNKRKVLEKLGYIKGTGLTEKGLFATRIYAYELMITELFMSGLYKKFSENQINVLVGAIVYEERSRERFSTKGTEDSVRSMIQNLSSNQVVFRNINKKSVMRMTKFITTWSSGGEFEDLLKIASLQEGDVIRLFRRMIDVLRQIRRAANDVEMDEFITRCMNRIDRDLIKTEF